MYIRIDISAYKMHCNRVRLISTVKSSRNFVCYVYLPLLQIAVLIKDLGELVMDIEEVLKNHLTVLNIKDPKDVDRLSHRVE